MMMDDEDDDDTRCFTILANRINLQDNRLIEGKGGELYTILQEIEVSLLYRYIINDLPYMGVTFLTVLVT